MGPEPTRQDAGRVAGTSHLRVLFWGVEWPNSALCPPSVCPHRLTQLQSFPGFFKDPS